MLGIIKKLFGPSRTSNELAKSRLSFVLVQDRTGLSNEDMATFKKELISVIGKYFVIDEQAFDIAYEREDDTTTLLINSPVVVKRELSVNGAVGSGKRLGKKNKKRHSNGSAAANS